MTYDEWINHNKDTPVTHGEWFETKSHLFSLEDKQE